MKTMNSDILFLSHYHILFSFNNYRAQMYLYLDVVQVYWKNTIAVFEEQI